MISRIRIQNFGSLIDVDVPLGPLTLLVGPNASGKTMFIRAIRALTKLTRSPLRSPKGDFTLDHATLVDLVSNCDLSREIRFAVWLGAPSGDPSYDVALAFLEGAWVITRETFRFGGLSYESTEPLEFVTERRGTIRWKTPGQPPRIGTLPYMAYPYRHDQFALKSISPLIEFTKQLGVSRTYRVGNPSLVSPRLPGWMEPDRPYVDDAGAGFVHTLARFSLSSSGRAILEGSITPWLQSLFPHIESIGFRPGPSTLFLEYKSDRYQRPLPAQLESDGVNLALFFSSLPYILSDPEMASGPTPVFVGLEEPEAGTHPFFQRSRLELLRKLVRRSPIGSPLQIVATTHSIDLLRWVEKEEALDTLRFVEHLGAGLGTRIHRLTSQEDLDRVHEQFDKNLGLAWYSGVFGAVPRHLEEEPED